MTVFYKLRSWWSWLWFVPEPCANGDVDYDIAIDQFYWGDR